MSAKTLFLQFAKFEWDRNHLRVAKDCEKIVAFEKSLEQVLPTRHVATILQFRIGIHLKVVRGYWATEFIHKGPCVQYLKPAIINYSSGERREETITEQRFLFLESITQELAVLATSFGDASVAAFSNKLGKFWRMKDEELVAFRDTLAAVVAQPVIPKCVKEFWSQRFLNACFIPLHTTPDAWPRLISLVARYSERLQNNVFEYIMTEVWRSCDYTTVFARDESGKAYAADWLSDPGATPEKFSAQFQPELDELHLSLIGKDRVREKWSGWGNTYAIEMYQQTCELLLSYEVGGVGEPEAFLQIAVYYMRGVRVGEICNVYVAPYARRQGWAKKYIALAEKMLIAAGAESLRVRASNKVLCPYLLACGYTETGSTHYGQSLLREFWRSAVAGEALAA